jgi:hypothetical protein
MLYVPPSRKTLQNNFRAEITRLLLSWHRPIRVAASTLDRSSSKITAESDPVYFGIKVVKDISLWKFGLLQTYCLLTSGVWLLFPKAETGSERLPSLKQNKFKIK